MAKTKDNKESAKKNKIAEVKKMCVKGKGVRPAEVALDEFIRDTPAETDGDLTKKEIVECWNIGIAEFTAESAARPKKTNVFK